MTTLAPSRPASPLDDLHITWELAAALAWWWARYGAARAGLALAAGLRAAPRTLVARPAQWAWGLPRENQAVLAVSLVAIGLAVQAVRAFLAAPTPWTASVAPPAWVVGIGVALFIARATRRPIVALAPFAAVLWLLFSPAVMVALVGVCLIATYWKTTTRTGHGHTTTHRTITGAVESTAHYAPSPGKARCPRIAAEHEGGHAAAAVAVGGRVLGARAFADGSGWCRARIPCGKSEFETTVRMVAFYAGGEVAQGNRSGCSIDQGHMSRVLDEVPGRQQAMARTAGYATARRAQSSHSHVRRAVASALIRTGRYQ